MKRKKKLLVSFLALNAILSAYTSATTEPASPRYEKMYNNIVKNIEQGKSNDNNYQTIERILKQRNKELKDLYLQGDYIVKPEYLEWQVFFTGFYEEYNEGVDNSKENARYHSKVTGYYDANGDYVVTSENINGLKGKPYQSLQQPKEIDLGIAIHVREPNRHPISLGVTKPSIPLVTPITPGIPSIAAINPVLPLLASFSVPNIGAPTLPSAVTVTPPTIKPIDITSFNPVTPNVTPPSLPSPPNFSIILGADCNTFCSTGKQTALDGKSHLQYTWSNSVGAEQNLAFRMGNDEGTTASRTFTGNMNFDSFNIASQWGAAINNSQAPNTTRNHQYFFVGGSRFFEFDNATGTVSIGDGSTPTTLTLKGILTLGLVSQQQNQTLQITQNAAITDKAEKDDPYIIAVTPMTIFGPSDATNTPIQYNISKTTDGYVGYKVALALVDENGGGLVTLSNSGEIDFRGNNSIGIYTYLPKSNAAGSVMRNESTGVINISGKESYGMKFGAFGGGDFINNGTINIRKNPNGVDKADNSVAMAVMDDVTVNNNVNVSTGRFINNGNINVTGNVAESTGMYLRILENNDMENSSSGIITVDSTGSGNVGMRVDTGTINTGGTGGPLAKNSGTINVSGGANFGMIANDVNSGRVATIQNLAGASINISGASSAGMYSTAGGMAENSGTIDVLGNDSIGIFSTTGAANKMTTGLISLKGLRATGVYNTNTFTLSGGTITSEEVNTIGIYSDNTNSTSITGGNVTAQNGGIALYSGNNSMINLSGPNILTANSGGLLFYNYVNGSGAVTGKYSITSGTTASVASGGLVMYMKAGSVSDIGTALTNLKGAFSNPTGLTINMASGSSILYIDGASGATNISDFRLAGLAPGGMTGFFNFTWAGIGGNEYIIKGINLTLDNTVDSSLDSGTYGNIQFLQSSVTVDPGVTVAGTQAGQVAIAQKNNTSGTLAGRYIINNGTISLAGNGSTGIAGDYITVTNSSTGKIKLSGNNSIGMYVANGTDTSNQGLIELGGQGSVGIYGGNYFDGSTSYTTLGYGNDQIDIENQKDIKTVAGGVSGDAFGIYADNNTTAVSSVNLTSTSNIDLKGTGVVIGAYLKKTNLESAGMITVESTTVGTSVGIYSDESTAALPITGSINVSGGSGVGIYLNDSSMINNAAITVDNVTSGAGIYVNGLTISSLGTNTGVMSLGDNVTGMYGIGVSALNTGTITNTGTIQSSSVSADKAIGMYVGKNGIGNNSGNIYLTALGTNEDQVGVYNSGTFNMTGGNIEVFSKNGAGLYATGSTNLSGGTIKTGNGAIGLYADGVTIILSGTYKSIVENGGIFALNNSGSGDINIASANIEVDVEAGGIAFSSVGAFTTYLSLLVTGTGTLEINLKDPTSKLAMLDTPGTILLSSIGTAYAPGSTIAGTNVKISSSSDPNYTPFSITKGHLIVDQAVNLDSTTDSYNKSDFINSSVDVNSTMTGTGIGQLGVGQVNYGTGSTAIDRARITINNNGTIDLSGNNSTGILADFGNVTNTSGSLIKMNGEESVGIYAANGTAAVNAGTINMGNKSVGIYGVNQLPGTPGYGDKSINISNSGNIVSTGTTHGGYGIYANNTAVPVANSVINLASSSNIDVSGSEAGIGIYAVNSTLNIDGNITVGKDGVGVYASGTTGTINGGTISLNGDNAIGYYLTNGSAFTNLGGTIAVNGQNITLMTTDASSSINLSTPFTVTSTPGSTYIVGNMIGGDFYNNTSTTLGSNGSLINGIGTAALFGTASNINSTGTNVSGIVLSGQHAGVPGHVVTGSATTVNEEGTNLGIITLGDSSAGMYLTGGARGRNEGIITINNNSVGIYAESSASLLSHIVNNNGIITLGQESTGLFLKDGSSVSNTGTAEINSTGMKAVGIYSENSLAGATMVTNSNKIDLAGDQSIGIYTTGNNSITNSGTVLIGNSLSQIQPGVGIYADNAGSIINNSSSGTITAGDNSIGVYNVNGNIINDGAITVGHGGTAIYSDGGTITLNMGSSITVGQNDGVGVYAINQAGTVINNSTLSVGDGSYGFVFTGATTPSFTNNQSAVTGNNSIFVFADSVLTADNSGILTMTGSDNIGYYLKNGGSFTNNADIIGNSGVSNIGVYAKGANIINNADILLGDSNLIEHTDASGAKYKTGYSVGIYGEDSNITNSLGSTIQVGKEGIGIYVKGAGYIAENYGTINGVGDEAKGIFATDYAIVNNYGVINMTGDNVMGIVGQNGAQIYNDFGAVINVTGNDVTGIYLAGDDTKLVNHGTINITGTGLGISYTPTVELSNVIDTTGTTQGYTSKQYDLPDMPTLVNTGVINVNVGGNFNYDGIKVIVTIDPSTNTPTTSSTTQVGFGGVIPDKLEVAPDFAVGTVADRYIFENIFKGSTGRGEYISQSLTWDATAQGSNLVMTRIAYTDFTDGLWFEDFGTALNEKYAVTYGEGRKIFDKINYITNEEDFRHVMASMAGNVYANINQRENDIAETFENSLLTLQESTNNTKENVKISVIAGKGKNKEETDGVVGYDYTTTGVLALREVERTYKHTFGYSLGYLHTGFEFNDGNSSEEWVDTIQLGVHNKYKVNGWTLRNDLTGRASIHNVDRNIDWPSPNSRSEMNGTYETYSITSDNILGKEFKLGKKAGIMPYGAFRAMYVTRPTFNESGLEALEVEGNDAWSAKPRAGVELKGAIPLGSKTAWQLKGTLDLAYEYELADLNEREKARLIAIEDGYHKLSKPEDEKGTFRTKAAVGLEVVDRYGIFLTGEYSTGNDKEDDYRAGVTLKAVF